MENETRLGLWNSSYERQENHVFEPSDEVVRFVSRFLRKRVQIALIIDVLEESAGMKVLDLGCGIGRHIKYGGSMGLDMYGAELSGEAVRVAHDWLSPSMGDKAFEKIKACDARRLPWSDGYFNHIISDSVIDSMEWDIAKEVVRDAARVLRTGGLFYCSLIALKKANGDMYNNQITVMSTHEQGTIQSFFDLEKIKNLFGDAFEIISTELHSIDNLGQNEIPGRWHLVLRRI